MSREDFIKRMEKKHAKGQVLLDNIKANLPELEKLFNTVSGHYYEDRMYRFYHQSFKVYDFQSITEDMIKLFHKITPHQKGDDNLYKLNRYYETIVNQGTCQNRKWEISHNTIFDTVTRPFIEAFLHSKYFLEMMVKYGKELESAPNSLPSGWAAILELYNIR